VALALSFLTISKVTVLDLSQKQIDAWNSDKLPIYEPGLEEVTVQTRARYPQPPHAHPPLDVSSQNRDEVT
jgi:UDP-glucose 6-dehydrogenase